MLDNGYLVHVTYYRDKDLAEKQFGRDESATIHRLDVSDEGSVRRVLQAISKISGKLHLLVNNATVDYNSSIEDMTLEQWNETFNVRV